MAIAIFCECAPLSSMELEKLSGPNYAGSLAFGGFCMVGLVV